VGATEYISLILYGKVEVAYTSRGRPLFFRNRRPQPVNAKNIKLNHGHECHRGSKPSVTVLGGNSAANFCV
jgi:hypothetical protein